jgi:hypothetical protein
MTSALFTFDHYVRRALATRTDDATLWRRLRAATHRLSERRRGREPTGGALRRASCARDYARDRGRLFYVPEYAEVGL